MESKLVIYINTHSLIAFFIVSYANIEQLCLSVSYTFNKISTFSTQKGAPKTMSTQNINHQLGTVLKELLQERALSMRQFGTLTDIDPSTISRIINGKQQAKKKHLQKFAECLQIPVQFLYDATYAKQPHQTTDPQTEMYTSIDAIQNTLQSSNLFDYKYTTTRVKQELENYERYAKTTEGTRLIHEGFSTKLQQLDSTGPFIDQLTDMYHQFCNKTITSQERAIIGSALLYFVLSTDIIPDYVFPIGYLDDAIAVELAKEKLIEIKNKSEKEE